MIDIRSKDRPTIEKLASEILPPNTELWAYGSRVKGTNSESSDLDLLVVFPVNMSNESENIDKPGQFKSALTDSTIPIFVDVFTWQLIPENFRQNILQTRKLFFCT